MMRVLMACLSGVALIGAGSPENAEAAEENAEAPPTLLLPSYGLSDSQARMIADAQVEGATPLPTDEQCYDRIMKVRAERGLPPIEDSIASGDDPLLTYAVDYRRDGCAMLVMRGNRDDVRPLPKPRDGAPFQRLPATNR